ncbi:sensor histidine kinase [Halorhabdus amylolytica]|uniref:sensor histidine kinase n=1 Tax=Halorhabdus amylolytica TaxID=2559573 RepID=UPI0010AB4971|nr:HAMP domain-containing sensor histidine kinase [Halorhabdus amylolytica]
MYATKRALGINYVTGTGVVLSVLFVPALTRGTSAATTSVAVLGLVAAIGLTATGVWLRACRLQGEQVWRVAAHVGLGIGILTVTDFLFVGFGAVADHESTGSALLASSIVIGGAGGALLGIAREFERSTRTLTQSTEVLSRALRHNLRNDLTVILGQLDELESEVSGTTREHVISIRRKVDEIAELSEQAQQIEVAVTGEGRRRHPVDAVEIVERRVRATRAANPGVRFETDLPETAWVSADWMLETAIENVLETAIANGGSETVLRIDVEHLGPRSTVVRIVDAGGHLPAAEIEPLNSGTETPLQHSEGLGLWLVNWIVEGFGGTLELDQFEDVCVVTLRLHRAIPTRQQRGEVSSERKDRPERNTQEDE